MRAAVLALGFGLLFGADARSADWVKVGEIEGPEGFRFYVDTTDVMQIETYRYAWTRRDNFQPLQIAQWQYRVGYLYNAYDCQRKAVGFVSGKWFLDRNRQEPVTSVDVKPEQLEMKPVLPDSLNALVMPLVCTAKLQ